MHFIQRPFMPLRFGTRIKIFINALDTASVTKDGSNKVSQWNDRTASANHFYQPTGANQCTYTASAINGKPGISFDGAATYMNTNNNVDLTAGFTLAYIGTNKTRKDFNSIFGIKASTSSYALADIDWAAGTLNSGNYAYAANRSLSGSTEKYFIESNVGSPVNTPGIYVQSIKTATTATLWLNGSVSTPTILGAGTSLIPASSALAFLGLSYGTVVNSTYVGNIILGSLIVATPALTDAEAVQLYHYLKRIYGI